MNTDRPFLSVRAIITNETGNVLILKRVEGSCGGGDWCLPGGSIDYGQTSSDAVIREIMEETSLTCHEVKFLFYLDSLPDRDLTQHYVNLFFLCNTSGRVILNHESSDYKWIGPGDMQKYKIAFKNDIALEKFWQINK